MKIVKLKNTVEADSLSSQGDNLGNTKLDLIRESKNRFEFSMLQTSSNGCHKVFRRSFNGC